MDQTKESPEQNKPRPAGQGHEQARTPNMGMGGAYDGDVPEMENQESGTSSHYPDDAAMDTGRESAQKATKGEEAGAGSSYDYQAPDQIASNNEGGRSPQMDRDPDMDTGNHARDVERDMIGPSENTQQPEMREPHRADNLSEDSNESDALPRDFGSEGTAGIP